MATEKIAGIYKITSPSGKVNIGQSWNIRKRLNNYKNSKCKGQPKMYNSLMSYGWDAHIFEIVHELPQDAAQEVMDKYEILYWQMYIDCGVNMLNVKEPGRGGKHSEETKRKLAIASTGHKRSPESIAKSVVFMTGRITPVETKLKISNSLKGHPCYQDPNRLSKIRGVKKGKQPEVVITKRVESRRGYKHSEETKTKIGNANRSKIDKIKKTPCKKQVICNETGQIFISCKDAYTFFGISHNCLWMLLKTPGKKGQLGFSFSYYIK